MTFSDRVELKYQSMDESRRISKVINQLQREADATVIAVVCLDRKDGTAFVIPHPHMTRRALELCAEIDWQSAIYVQTEFDL